MSLGAILGGIAGLITGGGSAMAAAVGAGLGSLASGGSLEDALKSGGSAFVLGQIPGIAGLGQSMGASLGMAKVKEEAVKAGAKQAAEKMGFMDFVKSPTGALAGISALGMIENMNRKQEPGGERFIGGERDPGYEGQIVVKPYIDETGKRTFQNPDGLGIMSTPQATSNMMPPTIMARGGGYIEGPGSGTSDSIKSMIYQNGVPVQEARLSDGEFVMKESAVRGAGDGDREKGAARMYALMNNLERRVA